SENQNICTDRRPKEFQRKTPRGGRGFGAGGSRWARLWNSPREHRQGQLGNRILVKGLGKMISDLNRIIEQVGKDKGIDKKILIEALEQALLAAARKKYGPKQEIESKYNEEAGEIELFQFKTVVNEV